MTDAEWMISMNSYYEQSYAMKLVSKELTGKLDANGIVVKPCQGIPWYNMLANLDYCQDFAYISTDNEKRAELIVDDDDNEDNDMEQSDLVALILNLGFIEEHIARGIHFGSGMSKEVKDKTPNVSSSRSRADSRKYGKLIEEN